ncbi:MAG: PASTA domain-containing protein [Oscillospiraceae bacterium]|jgi:stage V sporulation protein D (sporulation-specific penicillin-binding protein)|nr:PASTA domain-containing protein [Oscillospiraceae bacterium]
MPIPHKKRSNNAFDQSLKRSNAVLLVICFGFVGIGISLWGKSIVHGNEYRAKAEQNQLHDTEIRPTRGKIYDSNMELLAESAAVKAVVCWPAKFLEIAKEDERLRVMEQISKDLAPMINSTPEAVLSKFKLTKYGALTLRSQAEKPMSDAVSEYLFGKKATQTEPKVAGKSFAYTKVEEKSHEEYKSSFFASTVIGLDPDTKRYYPKGTFASTLIGFTGAGDEGRAGLEYQFNKELTGIPGRKITAKDAAGGEMDAAYDTYVDPVQGHSLVLTLDATIQRYLERELKQAQKDTQANATYGIVMEVQTGAILAMAGTPNYDLNEPFKITDPRVLETIGKFKTPDEKAKAENTAVNNMWKNHSIADIYYPGSVFKVITASMALEEKTWEMKRLYTDTGAIKIGGRTYHCHKLSGHGTQDFTQALMNSCNPYFVSVGQSVGVQKFSDYFEGFGFTEQTGFSPYAEAKPKPGVTYYPRKSMSIVDLASASFGQSFQVTPLQMLTAVNAIANGGKLMQPYIVARELDADGNAIKKNEPTLKRQVISNDTASKVTEMMRQVVIAGTGKNGYVPGYRVAGKTGTSQKMISGEHDGKYVASFVCFAPADNPKLAMLITIDEPVGAYNGSQIAAPVAERVMEDSLIYLNVPPKYTEEEKAVYFNEVPSVQGKAVKDAKDTLEKSHLTARVVGEGEKVVSQVPAAGEHLYRDGVVLLYTTKESKEKKTMVPNFLNKTPEEAKVLAANAGLNLKYAANLVAGGRDKPKAYRQDLKYGLEVAQGRTVTVYFKSYASDSDYTPYFVD